MTTTSFTGRIVPSILDRCCRADGASHPTRQKVIEAIQRDVNAMLNTSQRPLPKAGPHEKESCSLAMYGLPDLANAIHDEQQISKTIETAIARFEPRLAEARVVSAIRSADGLSLDVRLHATLRLHIEPTHPNEPREVPFSLQATLSLYPQHLEAWRAE